MRSRLLSPQQVKDIRTRWGAGQSAMSICEDMALTCSPELVYRVAVGAAYADLLDEAPVIERSEPGTVSDDDLVAAIEAFIAETGYAPTFREIGKAMGLRSPSSVKFALDRAKKNGRVTWAPNRARTIRIKENA